MKLKELLEMVQSIDANTPKKRGDRLKTNSTSRVTRKSLLESDLSIIAEREMYEGSFYTNALSYNR